MSRSMRIVAACAATLMFSGLANAQQFAQAKADPVQNYWSMFGEPDATIDVHRALAKNGQVVALTELGGHTYEVLWFSDTQSFEIIIDGQRFVEDLVTFEDEGFRPNFKGQFDEFGNSFISGFADVTPEGFIMVQLNVPGSVTTRVVTFEGSLISSTKCVCFGLASNKEDCSDADCDVSEECDGDDAGGAHCRWKYGLVQLQ